MKLSEVKKILVLVNSLERRVQSEVDFEATAQAWNVVIGDLDAQDAAVAVRDYFRTTDSSQRRWFVPGDIVAGARRVRAERRARELVLERRREEAAPRLGRDEIRQILGRVK